MAVTPLRIYDELVAAIGNTPVPQDWKKMCALINNLPEDHLKTIYVLVLHHYHLEQQVKPGGTHKAMTRTPEGKEILLPYNGKLPHGRKGVMYTIDNLPPLLQLIIAEYVKRVAE